MLSRGWREGAWLCCGARSKLSPRDPSKEPLTESENLLLKIFGEPEVDDTDGEIR